MSKRVFIYEPYATGHHVDFLRMLLAAFAHQDSWHTTILTSAYADRLAIHTLATEFKGQLEIAVAQPLKLRPYLTKLVGPFYAEQYGNSRSLAREFATLHQKHHFDFALLPYMEAVGIQGLAFRSFFGAVPWAFIAHGLRFHFRESGIKAPARRLDTLQRLCFLRVLQSPTLTAAFSLDPYLVEWAKHPKVVSVPVPSPPAVALDVEACRQSLGLPPDAIIVLVYGSIDTRKCLDLLLPAVAAIDPVYNVAVVVAGVQDRRMRPIFEGEAAATLRQQSRLVELNRFISAKEEEMLFGSADIVWTYYRDQLGASSVLVKAGQYSLPMIVNEVGVTGRVVADARCGLVIRTPEPPAVAQAIMQLVANTELRKQMGQRAFARFCGNTPEAFCRPIVEAIETT